MLDVNDITAVTLLIATKAIWVRRRTLATRCRWEIHATMAVLLASAGMALAMPAADPYIGKWLHAIFGTWQLDIMVGFFCWIMAAASVLIHTATRFPDDDLPQKLADRLIKPVFAIAMPLMAAGWFAAPNLNGAYPGDDFLAIPSSPAIIAIKATMCTAMAFLLGASIVLLILMRADPRSRPVANLQIVACVLALVNSFYISVSAFPAVQRFELHTGLFWYTGCASIAAYSLSAATSWRIKLRDSAR